MSDPLICNVCREPITEEADKKPRLFRVKATGRDLPPQYKHEACYVKYRDEKIGLEDLAK